MRVNFVAGGAGVTAAGRRRLLPLVCALSVASVVVVCVASAAQVSVLTQHNDNNRSGANTEERVLAPSNVNVARFGMLFKRIVDDQVYGQPLYVANVNIGGGIHDVVYITTVNNSVYAFDAGTPASLLPTGILAWERRSASRATLVATT